MSNSREQTRQALTGDEVQITPPEGLPSGWDNPENWPYMRRTGQTPALSTSRLLDVAVNNAQPSAFNRRHDDPPADESLRVSTRENKGPSGFTEMVGYRPKIGLGVVRKDGTIEEI